MCPSEHLFLKLLRTENGFALFVCFFALLVRVQGWKNSLSQRRGSLKQKKHTFSEYTFSGRFSFVTGKNRGWGRGITIFCPLEHLLFRTFQPPKPLRSMWFLITLLVRSKGEKMFTWAKDGFLRRGPPKQKRDPFLESSIKSLFCDQLGSIGSHLC